MEKLYAIEQRPNVATDKAPLIVLLHGYGSNERDLFAFAGELPANAYIVSLRAPHPLGPESYAWFAINFMADDQRFSDIPQAIDSRDQIAATIRTMIDTLPIDATNITLIGFSQGCILSLAVALSNPGLVKNVIGLSGYVNRDLLAIPAQAQFGDLRFFISHGTVDQVIPVEWARQTPAYLESLNLPVTYKEYPVGHGVAPQNFYDLLKWLEQ